MTEKLSREDLREAAARGTSTRLTPRSSGSWTPARPSPAVRGWASGRHRSRHLEPDDRRLPTAVCRVAGPQRRAVRPRVPGRAVRALWCEHPLGRDRALPAAGQHFVVGETCADERMTLVNRAGYDLRLLKKKEEARAAREALALSQLERMTTYPAEAEYLLRRTGLQRLLRQPEGQIRRYGALSEKQTATITRQIVRDAERKARFAERDALLAEHSRPGRRSVRDRRSGRLHQVAGERLRRSPQDAGRVR